MKIFQSLYDASLYRTVALIPEQTLFGLALSATSKRDSSEAKTSLRHGREFCNVLYMFVEKGQDFRPDTDAAATIAAALQELPQGELPQWKESMVRVVGFLDAVLAGGPIDAEQLADARKTLRSFAAFAKQSANGTAEADHPRLTWH